MENKKKKKKKKKKKEEGKKNTYSIILVLFLKKYQTLDFLKFGQTFRHFGQAFYSKLEENLT